METTVLLSMVLFTLVRLVLPFIILIALGMWFERRKSHS